MKTEYGLTRAAGTVGGATFLSRILGFLRDMVIAKMFGAHAEADAFFVAFRIPNLLRGLLAEGSLSSAFIPVFTEFLTNRSRKETEELANVCLTALTALLVLIVLVCIVMAKFIVMVIAPGFVTNADKVQLTILLTRVMFPYILFISLAAVVMGMLNSFRVFLVPALSPVFLNLTMIGAALFLAPRMSEPSLGLAFGVVLGGILQLGIQIPSLIRAGHRFRPAFIPSHPGFRKILKLILPSVMGMAVLEVNLFVDTMLASLLQEGSVSYLYYGNRLVQFPLGVFGVAMGTAVLPTLSSLASKNNLEELKRVLSFSLQFVLFLSIPAMVGLIVLREPIINVLLEHGRFTRFSTTQTAFALLFFSMGLCGFTSTKVLVSAFYAQQDTPTPVRVANYCMLANIFFSLMLMGPLRHGGIALATSLSSLINSLVLAFILRRRLRGIEGTKIWNSFRKLAAASAVMGAAAWVYSRCFFHLDAPLLERIFHLGAALFVPALIYFLLLHWMNSPELNHLKNLLRRKAGRAE